MYLNFESLIRSDNPEETLTNLQWPVPELEKEYIFSLLEQVTRSLLRGESDSYDGLILRSCAPLLVSSIFNSIYTSLVVARTRERYGAVRGFYPSSVENYSWAINGGYQSHDIAAHYLKRHVNLKKFIKQALFAGGGANSDVMTLTMNPTLKTYLELENLSPSPSSFTDWFSLTSVFNKGYDDPDAQPFCRHVFESILDSIDSQYHSNHLAESVQSYISFTINFCRRHLFAQLQSSRAKKIRRLYTATQGFIGTRLISLSVKENGGEVLSFPHSGAAMLYLGNNWQIEDLTSTKAFCYNVFDKKRREAYRDPMGADIYASLSVLPEAEAKISNYEYSGGIRNVLYTGGGYPGDRFWPAVLPELIRLRLELEILDALIEKGIKVTIKMHFKSTPKAILDFFSKRYSGIAAFDDTPLRELLKEPNKYDAYVSENITGGSLSEMMKTKKPIILVTPFAGCEYIEESALKMFEKRVSIVRCGKDSAGLPRLVVDDLYEVLDRQTHSIDFEYVKLATNTLFEY